jgi:hypothetical protein
MAIIKEPDRRFNGRRAKGEGEEAIYLVDRGYLRHVPNPRTYVNLFPDWEGLDESEELFSLPFGKPISDGAILARAEDDDTVYLVEHGVKRPLASREVLEKYHFDETKIKVVPPIVLDGLTTGPTLE